MGIQATPVEERTNPLHRITGAALVALERVAGAPAWAMTPEQVAEALVELAEVQARFTEVRWRLMAAAGHHKLGEDDGSTSPAAWLSRRTRETRTHTNGLLRGALTLDDPRFTLTREAFAAGLLHEEQVWVIIRAVEDLPDDEVTEEDRVLAQKHLIDLAADHDAKRLRVLAKKLFEVLAPDEAERREGEALEREERKARERCRFSMRDNGDGTTSGWFKLPTLHAEILNKAVQAFAAPRRQDPQAWVDTDGRKVPYPVLLGQAFADLVEHLPTDKLPQAGGVAGTVVITIDLDTLRTGLGAASLGTHCRISAGEARRLACNAGIIPAVLGKKSAPLDLGHKARLFTDYQRTAMALRDKGCTAEGCDRPPAWCEAHHDEKWSEGGQTNLNHGRLLCPFHHRLAHNSHYETKRLTDNKVRFRKRS